MQIQIAQPRAHHCALHLARQRQRAQHLQEEHFQRGQSASTTDGGIDEGRAGVRNGCVDAAVIVCCGGCGGGGGGGVEVGQVALHHRG